MAQVTYRAAEADDAEAVQACALAAWRHTYAGIFTEQFIEEFVGSAYAPSQLRAAAARAAAGEASFDVALDGGAVVGFCHIGLAPAPTLYRIYLLPAYIGRGVGGALLSRGEHFLTSRGIESYRCFVHRANAVGRAFYERRGFRRLPELDRDDELALEKRLSCGPLGHSGGSDVLL